MPWKMIILCKKLSVKYLQKPIQSKKKKKQSSCWVYSSGKVTMWGNKRVTFAPNDRRGTADVAFGHSEESPSYSLSKTFYCTAVTAALSPTLYAVGQELGSRLLPLLSKSYQSQRFIEGQFAQESIRGVNMLCNLKQTKTIWPEGRQIWAWDPASLVVCVPLCKKLSLDTEGMIRWKVRKRGILFHRGLALK